MILPKTFAFGDLEFIITWIDGEKPYQVALKKGRIQIDLQLYSSEAKVKRAIKHYLCSIVDRDLK